MKLGTQSEQEWLLNHVYQHNGLSKWTNQLRMQLLIKQQKMQQNFIRHVSMILSCNGWKMFMIGLFHVNFGGDIKFQLGIMKRVKCMLVKKHQREKVGHKTKMCSILGLVQLCGHFQQWVGQMKTQQTSNVISQQVPL